MNTTVSPEITKTVKIGDVPFEIPAHMTVAGMAECWQGDSQALEAAATAIVEHAPRFAAIIVHKWLDKNNCYQVPRSEFMTAEECDRLAATLKK